MRFASALILSLLAALLVASDAQAEACTCNSSDTALTWSVITGAGGGGVNQWDGCTPSGDDTFTVGSGCVVTQTGDIVATATTMVVAVQSGGTYQANVTGAAGLRLVMGGSSSDGSGFDCQTGATCKLKGGYRSFGVNPAVTETTQNTSVGRYWQAGSPLPCPHLDTAATPDIEEPDCGATAGNERFVRLNYPSAIWDQGAGATYGSSDPHFDTAIAALDNNTDDTGHADVVCGFDPDLTDAYAGAETNFCYWLQDVVQASPPTGTQLHLDLDIIQSSLYDEADENIFPVSLRQVKECVLQADVTKRTVTCPSTFLAASGEREGYWIYFQDNTELCGDADATPCTVYPRPYRISNTVDGGAGVDTLTLADMRGVERTFVSTCAVATDCNAWVVPAGFREGDPLSIWVPFVVRSQTTGRATAGVEEDGPPRFTSTLSEVQATVFDATGRLNVQDPSLWRDTWAVDVCAGAHVKVRFAEEPVAGESYQFGHTTVTGVCEISADASGEGGIVSEATGNAGATVTMEDIAIRHVQTSFINMTTAAQYTLRRYRAQYRAKAGISTAGGCWQQDDSVGNVVTDAECIDAGSITMGATGNVIRGVTQIGGIGVWLTQATGGADEIRQLTVIDVDASAASPFFDDVELLDGFVVRDVQETGGTQMFLSNASSSTRNGLVMDSEAGGAVYQANGAGTTHRVDNVAFLNADTGGSQNLMSPNTGAPTMKYKNLTFAWDPNAVAANFSYSNVVNVGAVPGAGSTIENVLIYGSPRSTAAIDGAAGENYAWSGCLALFRNVADIGSTLNTDFGNGTVTPLPTFMRSKALGLRDLFRERATVSKGLPGYGCGASERAGITRPYWSLSLSGLEPESLGTVTGGSGGRAVRTY